VSSILINEVLLSETEADGRVFIQSRYVQVLAVGFEIVALFIFYPDDAPEGLPDTFCDHSENEEDSEFIRDRLMGNHSQEEGSH